MDRNENKNAFKNVQNKRNTKKMSAKLVVFLAVAVVAVIVCAVISVLFWFRGSDYKNKYLEAQGDSLQKLQEINELTSERDNLQEKLEKINENADEPDFSDSGTEAVQDVTKEQSMSELVTESELQTDLKSAGETGQTETAVSAETETETTVSAETETETAVQDTMPSTFQGSLDQQVGQTSVQYSVTGIGDRWGIKAANIVDPYAPMQVTDMAKLYVVGMVYDGLKQNNDSGIRMINPADGSYEENGVRKYLVAMLNRRSEEGSYDIDSDEAAEALIEAFSDGETVQVPTTVDDFCDRAGFSDGTSVSDFRQDAQNSTTVADCVAFFEKIAKGSLASLDVLGNGEDQSRFDRISRLLSEQASGKNSEAQNPPEVDALIKKGITPLWISQLNSAGSMKMRETVLMVRNGDGDGYILYIQYDSADVDTAQKVAESVYKKMMQDEARTETNDTAQTEEPETSAVREMNALTGNHAAQNTAVKSGETATPEDAASENTDAVWIKVTTESGQEE